MITTLNPHIQERRRVAQIIYHEHQVQVWNNGSVSIFTILEVPLGELEAVLLTARHYPTSHFLICPNENSTAFRVTITESYPVRDARKCRSYFNELSTNERLRQDNLLER